MQETDCFRHVRGDYVLLDCLLKSDESKDS